MQSSHIKFHIQKEGRKGRERKGRVDEKNLREGNRVRKI